MPLAPPDATVLLVRHGATHWNLEKRWQGQTDTALAPLGVAQAERAARLLVGEVAAVAASTLARASVTGDIIARITGSTRLPDEPGLIERFAAEWEGLTRSDIEARWPGAIESPWRPPGYESDESAIERALPVVRRLLADAAASGRRIAAVTHGGIGYSLSRAIGVDHPHIGNLCGMWLTADPDAMLGIRMCGWFDPEDVDPGHHLDQPTPVPI